jgi:hypothetical protein
MNPQNCECSLSDISQGELFKCNGCGLMTPKRDYGCEQCRKPPECYVCGKGDVLPDAKGIFLCDRHDAERMRTRFKRKYQENKKELTRVKDILKCVEEYLRSL